MERVGGTGCSSGVGLPDGGRDDRFPQPSLSLLQLESDRIVTVATTAPVAGWLTVTSRFTDEVLHGSTSNTTSLLHFREPLSTFFWFEPIAAILTSVVVLDSFLWALHGGLLLLALLLFILEVVLLV